MFKYDASAKGDMSDIERIDQRLSAVERAVVDGDIELEQLADLATLAEDLERLENRLEAHERRIAELEGTVDAVSGFVGNVETVNEGVERQADAAIAAVDRLEYRIDELERTLGKQGIHEFDLDDNAVTSERTETNSPALEGADIETPRSASGQAAGIGTEDTDSTSAADAYSPFGEASEVEETAGKLLDETEPSDGSISSAANESNGGRGVTADGPSDQPVADEAEESTTLLTSLRNRLP